MIKVDNLVKIYRTHVKKNNLFLDFFAREYEETKALKGISFEIGDNELIGFIGPNGAGKTTTLKILSGILYPTSGKVNVLGFTPFEKRKEFLKQIAFVMGQKNQLLWELPPEDSYRLFKAIYEIDDQNYRRHLSELVELLDAQKIIGQPVRGLSLGQRMRAELIGALLHRPKVLFLDEPTIGLDIFAQTTIINFIREYQRKYKATIILTSHYMKDIQRLARRVLMIDRGNVIFDGLLSRMVGRFSREKEIQIALRQKVSPELLKGLDLPYEYGYPVLKIRAPKEKLLKLMQTFLPRLDYSDFTLEDEPIEEVIKKVFQNSAEKA